MINEILETILTNSASSETFTREIHTEPWRNKEFHFHSSNLRILLLPHFQLQLQLLSARYVKIDFKVDKSEMNYIYDA